MTSKPVSSGLAEMTSAVMPAVSGVALEVPPNNVTASKPRVVVMANPSSGSLRYVCELLVGAQMPMPVP